MLSSSKGARQINKDDIPKTASGGNDWVASVGKTIRFQYDEIAGELRVISYNPSKTALLVEYDGKVSTIHVSQLVKGQLGNVVAAINHAYEYQPGDLVQTKSGNLKILEQTTALDKNGWKLKSYRYQCLQCGHVGTKLEGNMKKRTGCEVCMGVAVSKETCIAHTSPEIAKYLVDPDDGLRYSCGSEKKVRVRCPDCGNEFEVSVSKLVERGLRCQFCGDGVSVPEKYAAELLKQVETQTGKHFVRQVAFDWSAPLTYDFVCFEEKIIIETHGIQHYNGGFHSYGARSLKDEQDNDRKKACLAETNGYRLIVIDCRYSEYDYLTQSFKDSALLQELFPEVEIDFERCFAQSQKTLVRDVANLFNRGMTRSEIAAKLDLGKTTVSRHLRRATALGWCKYDPKSEMRESGKKNAPDNKTKVRCNETGVVFDSLTAAADWCGISISCISAFLTGSKKKLSAGKHPITKEKLTWSYVDDE